MTSEIMKLPVPKHGYTLESPEELLQTTYSQDPTKI